jgi:hypothetical protein
MPRVKNTGSTKIKQDTKLPIGTHRLMIKAIQWARKENGEQMANSNGELAIDIHFADNLNRIIIHRFWLTDAAMWALDNLRKATGTFKEMQQTPVSEIVGKECFGTVAGEFFFTDEQLSRNEKGEPLMQKHLIAKFSPIVGDILPASMGDPKRNNGVPAGDFLVNKGVALEEFFSDEDKLWMLKQCGLVKKFIPIPNELVNRTMFDGVNDDF